MKNLTTIMLVLVPLIAWSQEKTSQAFHIHEDRVKPSMVADYEKASMALISALKEHNIEGPSWLTSTTSDSRYLYVGKIDDMADLDKNIFAPLAEKIGMDATSELLEKLDNYYDQHGSYILHLDYDLSYQPEGINQNPEGQTYRRFIYLYATPANYQNLIDNVKAHKALSEAKGSKWYYRIYRSGFGTMDSYIMVAIAAKNAIDYETRRQEMLDLLGSEREELMKKTSQNLLRSESVTGEIRNDLSYKSN